MLQARMEQLDRNARRTLLAASVLGQRFAIEALVPIDASLTGNCVGSARIGYELNLQRLQLMLATSPAGVFDMTRADRRAGFENPFGANGADRL